MQSEGITVSFAMLAPCFGSQSYKPKGLLTRTEELLGGRGDMCEERKPEISATKAATARECVAI